MLELICQPAGSGKTRTCLELFRASILKPGPPLGRSSYYIVPNREHAGRIHDLLLRKEPGSWPRILQIRGRLAVPAQGRWGSWPRILQIRGRLAVPAQGRWGRKPLAGLIDPAVFTINEFLARVARISVRRTPGDLVRRSLIRSALAAKELSYFQAVCDQAGFHQLVSEFISEAKQGFLSAADFEKRAAPFMKEPSVFARKLEDLAFLFKSYDEGLASLGLEDPDDFIKAFVRQVSTEAGVAFEQVIFDGFFHFTKAQLEFIRTLSRLTRRIIVTLTMDKDPVRKHVFEYPARTREALLEMGFREKHWAGKRNARTDVPALAFLEKNLFAPECPPFGKREEAVQIFEATGVSGEVEMVAREIRRLYRDGPYHFSDFCILLRSIGPYERVIRSVFKAFHIPVDIHERKRLTDNPFIRALVRWLRLLQRDWRREDLFSLLESNYYGFNPEAVRRLEASSLEAGVLESRAAWEELLAKLGPEESQILGDLLGSHRELLAAGERPEAAAAPAPMRWDCKAAAKLEVSLPAAFRKVLLDFISNRRMLDYQDAGAAGSGTSSFAAALQSQRTSAGEEALREDYEAYRSLTGLMDELILQKEIGSPRPAGLHEYLERLLEAIQVSLFSLRVPEKNCVQVYDIAFALQKEYKVVFAAGLLERVFPQRITEDPILKDDERKALNGASPCFEERLARVAGERYFFYMTVTRAAEKLYLTYPRFDAEGKESLPSFYVEEVKTCLGRENVPVRVKEVGDVLPALEEVTERKDLYQILALELFEKRLAPEPPVSARPCSPSARALGRLAPPDGAFRQRGLTAALLLEFLGDSGFGEVLREAVRDEEEAKIRDPKILAWFEGRPGPFSPTQLELFATCPFKFFSERVLNLRPEPKPVDPRILGIILHRVFELFYRELAGLTRKEEWLLFRDKEEAKRQALERLAQALGEHPLPGVKKYVRDLERAKLEDAVKAFIEEESRVEAVRKTAPRFVEQAFGLETSRADSLGPLKIEGEAGEDISLCGVIDRVDVDPETKAAVVIDYKRGAYRADKMLEHLEKGTELQIPIYLLAVQAVLGLKPAAGELYPLLAPAKRRGIYEGTLTKDLLGLSGRKSGVLDPETFSGLLEAVRSQILACVRGIRKGDVRIRSKGCDHCDFDHVCRFEKWKLIYHEEEKIWPKAK